MLQFAHEGLVILDRFRQFVDHLNGWYLAKAFLLALGYLITAKLGLGLAFSTHQVTSVWPPSGIALAALLILGYRYWPAILLGAFLANIMTDEPWFVAAGIAVGNTCEALTGAYLLKVVAGYQPLELLNTMRSILTLLVLGALVSTLVGTTIGTLSLAVGGLVLWSHFVGVWLVWWIGDTMGVLIVTPTILCLVEPECFSNFWRRRLEASAVFVLSYVIGILIFTYSSQGSFVAPLPYMTFPVLMWAALRFTQFGVVISLFIFACTAIWGTVSGLGPFASNLPTEVNLLLLQLFLFTASVTFLLVSVAIAERARVTEALSNKSKELEEAQAKILHDLQERNRLVRQLADANKRITGLLEEVLDKDIALPRRSRKKADN